MTSSPSPPSSDQACRADGDFKEPVVISVDREARVLAPLRARLRISIPALMFCFSFGVGVVCYQAFLLHKRNLERYGKQYIAAPVTDSPRLRPERPEDTTQPPTPPPVLVLSPPFLSQEYPTAEEYARFLYAAEQIESFMLFAVLLGATLSGMAGYLLARTILIPLRSLTDGLEAITTTGQWAGSSAVASAPPEIDQLGHNFSRMIDHLNDYARQRDSLLMECFSGPLVLVDVQGAVISMNTAAEKFLSAEKSELIGQSFADWLRQFDSQAPLAEAITNARTLGIFPSNKEMEVMTPVSGMVPILTTINPLHKSEQQQVGYSINFRQTRSLHRIYEQIQQADRLAAIGTFATGLAHEIRNPLGSVKGIAQLLREELCDNEKANGYLEIIVREVNRLDKVVRSVLNYAQPSHSPRERDNLNRLMDEALALAVSESTEIDHPTASIPKDYCENPQVCVQPEKIIQALINLIRNALEAVPPDGEVILRTQSGTDADGLPCYEAQVINTGETIPPETLIHIFEPFFSTKESGSGLGLAISSQMVAASGGRLMVDSEEGRTVFTVRLPTAERGCEDANP